jgi:hypothetical protein
MDIPGHIANGVVVLDGGRLLPEGTAVIVSCLTPVDTRPKRRIELPLVSSEHPGSVQLTAARIADILEQEDVSG